MVNFGEFLKTSSLRSNSVTTYQTGQFNLTKIGGNAKIEKFKYDIMDNFHPL